MRRWTPAADLYSAGCLLFELLTGRPPFIGDSPVSVAYQHVREDPPSASSLNPDVTPALDSVLVRALQKDRDHRFQDALSFRRALLDAARGIAVPAVAAAAPTVAMDVTAPHRHAGRGAAAPFAADLQTHSTGRAPGGHDLPDHPEDDGRLDVLSSGDPVDQHHDRRRRSSRTAWITVFFVAVLLVLAGGYVVLNNVADDRASQEAATTVSVPDLVGLTEADATDAIVDAGLVPSTDEEYNASVDEGDVIESDPAAGASVDRESRVNITVSLGPANVVLPDTLAGLTEASARDALEVLGLRGGRITEETSADVTDGRVITTNPQAGQSVPVGSAVDLVLSNGKVTMPLLTDLTLEQAQALLADPAVKLPFAVREVENSVVAPGIVTAQSAPARSEVDQGTEIVLTVATAPPAEPAPAPSTTPASRPTATTGEPSDPRPTEGGD
ncbi:PASTA domain-containing protein [Arthrobacter agilis]|uniref:PASTA domain-containing protein n=1 Tax=Arthrobacter agilis TaxID=37921 RepID=UPI00277E564A|nr:PASTA domain-containing protein [Arthrobacter agilis]MDQ0736677.1 beta-lactam-binding protein with PASTA domain [Arthrobacter agilis]